MNIRLPTFANVAVLSSFVLAGLSAQPAAAQSPPLTGETFDGFTTQNTALTSFNCNPDGDSSFSYSSSGRAGPPYIGTYMETGTVEIGPQADIPGTGQRGELMRLDAEFTIDSTLGEVTGHKHLLRTPFDPLTNWGACGTSTEFATPFDFGVAVTPSLCYHATLPDGTVDEGRSEILLAAVDVPPIKDTGLQESFVSDPSVSCELDDDDGDDDGGENGDDDGGENGDDDRDEDGDDNGSDG